MAIEVTLVPELTPTVLAGVSHASNQGKFVQVMASGVLLADVRSAAYTSTYVLQNAPASGEACSVSHIPNVAKVIAGEAVTRGQCVQPMSASGLAAVTSGGNAACVGTAWSTVAGSGEYLAVKLGR